MADIISMEALGQLIGADQAISWFDSLNTAANAYNINTVNRAGAWLGQLMEESDKFTLLEESLNYSASSLLRVFPNHFDTTSATQYAHQPKAIANRVYSNRMGNGDEASGDGWQYRGRGLIQITGKDNYNVLTKALNFDFINYPDNLFDPSWAALSAAWYWEKNGCNELADNEEYIDITKAINGGTNGLSVRVAYTQQAERALSVT